VNKIAARARWEASRNADPRAMHTSALVDLLYGRGDGTALDRSISALHASAVRAERRAPVLADLAAAYILRAGTDHTPRDLVAAVELADQALQLEPHTPAALFNLALALQRFGLVEESAQSWRDYLAVDSSSAWAHEARANQRIVLALAAPPAPPPGHEAPLSEYAAYAAAEPQHARVLGWCRVLGEWAQAVAADDEVSAEAQLKRAETLAAALEARAGADATLGDGVRAIRARTGGRDLRRLARAHREFSAGCPLQERGEFRAAAARFAAAAYDASASPALRTWARLLYGGMLFRSVAPREGEAIIRGVAARTDSLRHPALLGYARLSLAARLLRSDRYEAALQQAGIAAGAFARAGERENEGAALDAIANVRFLTGDLDGGYAMAHRALGRLRPYRSSFRLHNLLSYNAELVSDDGFPRAGVRMQSEGVRVARRSGMPLYVAEALLTRARLSTAAGVTGRTAEDVRVALPSIEQVNDRHARRWMVAQRQMADAAGSLRGHPLRSAAALDSAARFFRGLDAPLVAFPAVVGGAHARLAAGDRVRGTAQLEAALTLLERRRDFIRMEPRRAAVFEAARGLVDQVVMQKLAAGATADALAYLDRGRASLATAGRVGAVESTGSARGRKGEVALEYAIIGDTLLVWTVAGERIELYRTVVDTVRLVRTIDRARALLEARAPEADVLPALSLLHDWLVRPVQARLAEAGTPLAVIVDGDLAGVPFAALYDARKRRYLVEEHPLRFSVSLRESLRAPARGGPGEAWFVADPAFDPARNRGLSRLAESVVEVETIAAGYPRSTMLRDTAAHVEAVRAALARAGLLHYAGHAVFDDERPERSYLLLSAPHGVAGRDRLDAGDIAQMDLRHLSLVVLAACQTVRTGKGRAAGFSGLAGAFLAAGAGGAIGSLWRVDDRYTRELMVEFHRAHTRSGNAAGALREAQLRLLRSGDEEIRSPSAWAGFRYAGS
jgi:CHAT domain-containing protein